MKGEDVHGAYITNLSYEIAADEPEIWVFYTFFPGQRQIINADPDDCQEGFPAYAAIDNIEGISRPLTEAECDAFFANKKGLEDEEERAFETYTQRHEDAREAAQEARCEAWRDRETA